MTRTFLRIRAPEMKAVFFDLGGTLWKPFGTLSADAVVKAAAQRAAASLFSGPGEESRRAEFCSRLILGISGLAQARSGALEEGLFSHPSFAEVTVEGQVRQAIRETRGEEERAGDCALEFGHALAWYSASYPESAQVLSRIRDTFPGIVTGIVSNTAVQPLVIDHYLKQCGLGEYFDFRVYSSAAGWRKPHPAIYSLALAKAGVCAEEAVFIGDRIAEDVLGPKRLGMKAVLCWRNSPAPSDSGADAVVSDLSPVPELLKAFA